MILRLRANDIGLLILMTLLSIPLVGNAMGTPPHYHNNGGKQHQIIKGLEQETGNKSDAAYRGLLLESVVPPGLRAQGKPEDEEKSTPLK